MQILDHLSVLADPVRCRLLRLLEGQELTVSELCAVLQLPQSTVSRHLKTLGDDGWLNARRDGTSHFYSMSVDGLGPAAAQLWPLLRVELAATPAAGQDDRRLRSVLARRRTRSQQFFASAAGEWNDLRRELFGETFTPWALLGLIEPTLTVGDLACGTGHVSEMLAPHVARVIAVDGSPDMLAGARARLADLPNVEVRPGELEALPIEDATLDAAVLSLVLHYAASPPRVLAEAARVLRPGGRVLVVDMLPHERDEYQRQMGHVWLGFAERQIAAWLAAAGFEEPRIFPLPADPAAKGPSLFVALAARPRP